MDDKKAKILYYMFAESSEIKYHNDILDERITASEKLLNELGIDVDTECAKIAVEKNNEEINKDSTIKIRAFDEIYLEANEKYPFDISITEFFTEEELKSNSEECKKIEKDFDRIYKLDRYDYVISTIGAVISSLIDIFLVGIPQKTAEGLKAGSLANCVREYFEKKFPEEKMQKLANESFTKVSYDAQDNRNTVEYVEGLSAYYHRLLSLGHDPLIGFVVGILDILNGSMTTIDKKGKITIQIIEEYSERKGKDIFEAITKQIIHLESDITTSMGLPAPLMALFNLLQFGEIGDDKQTIAEIVQGMYYEGFDFIHFCSQSISVMVLEAFVRLCSFIRYKKNEKNLKEKLPTSFKINNNPKLVTMLFVGHLEAVAINTGKVYFMKNFMAINYAEWLAFANSMFRFAKYSIISKPNLRIKYLSDKLDDEFQILYSDIEESFNETFKNYQIEF